MSNTNNMGFSTKTSALSVLRDLTKSDAEQSKTQNRLSTGYRINTAADDAAGLALANQLKSGINAKAQGERNVYDGVSLAQVYEQSLQGINQNLGRLQELAVAAGNGIYDEKQRAALQAEAYASIANAQQIINNTEFAGKKLFGADASVAFETGGGTLNLTTTDVAAGLQDRNVFSIDLTSSAGAQAALETIGKAQQFVGELQSQAGVEISRFASTARNLSGQQIAESAARSRLADLDMAKTSTELTGARIREQASLAVAAQARIPNDNAAQLLGLFGN